MKFPQDCSSIPCTLYTLASPLLTSLGLSHPPYPCFIHMADPHVRISVPDPAGLTRQDPDIVYYHFGSVATARRPISTSPLFFLASRMLPKCFSSMYHRKFIYFLYIYICVSHQWCDLFYRLLHSYTRHIERVVRGERDTVLSA
jgi:hypothetical protein